MARPKKQRTINIYVQERLFAPREGIASTAEIKADELEAMRLCDREAFYQEKAAGKMGVSRRTLERMLDSGRKKVADALIMGKAIRITRPEYVKFRKGVGP
jgi:predicted DNA-binding protein (UPF0251 family)